MTMDRPQELYDERDLRERVDDKADHAPADEQDHMELVPHERDRVAAQERDLPENVESAVDHAGSHERVEDERDGEDAQDAERATATATALSERDGAGLASMVGEQPTVPEDRDAWATPQAPVMPTSVHGDFEVYGPGELEDYRSRWESIQL